jgi:hypothetical protein
MGLRRLLMAAEEICHIVPFLLGLLALLPRLDILHRRHRRLGIPRLLLDLVPLLVELLAVLAS